MNSIQLIFTFILVILLSLTAHELGHFIFAKILEVTVQEFSVGTGPKIFPVNHKGTLYSLSLLPLMAHVSLTAYHATHLYKEILFDIESENKLDSDLIKLANGEHFKQVLKKEDFIFYLQRI